MNNMRRRSQDVACGRELFEYIITQRSDNLKGDQGTLLRWVVYSAFRHGRLI